MKIRKVIAIFLVASLILSISACNKAPLDTEETIPAIETTDKNETSETIDLTGMPGVKDAVLVTDADSLTGEEMPMYYRIPDDVRTIKLFFADEGKEIPYLDTDTVKELMEDIYHDARNDKKFALSVSTEGHKAIFTRENNSTMVLDCDENTIRFNNYDAFIQFSFANTIIEAAERIKEIPFLDESETRSYSRNGSEICIYLDPYAIDLIEKDGVCYMPMQTFSDLLVSLSCYVNLLYNGESVFVNERYTINEETLLRKYYETKADNQNRSEKLAEFTYQELCLAMDCFYGLKDRQKITSFDQYFIDIGLKESLLSTDMEESSMALADVMELYLSDGHSFYLGNSYRIGEDFVITEEFGQSIIDYYSFWWEVDDIRKEYYPDGVPGYEEIGNTAYITFDNFDFYSSDWDYYNNIPTSDNTDTVGICLYAFSQITREDSPIENVVLDLSENTGGDTNSAFFVICMFVGTADICYEDTFTGAYSNNVYRCDANLDGIFDEKDSLSNYRLFCLTSPVSFSCGNLVPYIMKDSKKVNLIGMSTGGGGCTVMPLSIADGTIIQISGFFRVSDINNGSLYDFDYGIEPDYAISSIERFYDRDALTEYINSIY